MTVVIELSEDQAAALKARAASQGLTLEDWFRKLAAAETINHSRQRKGRYNLTELIQQCDTSALPSEEDRAWLDDAVVGREAL